MVVFGEMTSRSAPDVRSRAKVCDLLEGDHPLPSCARSSHGVSVSGESIHHRVSGLGLLLTYDPLRPTGHAN